MKLSYNPEQLKAAAKHIYKTNDAIDIWPKIEMFEGDFTWKEVRYLILEDLISKAKENWYWKESYGKWKFSTCGSGGYCFIFDSDGMSYIWVDILVNPAIGSFDGKEVEL